MPEHASPTSAGNQCLRESRCTLQCLHTARTACPTSRSWSFADEAIAEFFDNPTVPREEKTQLIDEIAKSSELQPHVVNFLNVVVDNFRAAIVPQIVAEFENVYNALTGTEVATVTSVVQLESQDLAQIAQHVQKMTGAQNVRLKTQLNPELIAGFTVQYGRDGSNLIDMSVRKQIEEIASEFELPSVPLEV